VSLCFFPSTLEKLELIHLSRLADCFAQTLPRVGLGAEIIDSLHFLVGCSKRQLNQAQSVFFLAYFLSVLLFIKATNNT